MVGQTCCIILTEKYVDFNISSSSSLQFLYVTAEDYWMYFYILQLCTCRC